MTMSRRALVRAPLLTLRLRASALAGAALLALAPLQACDKGGTQAPEADATDKLTRSLIGELAAGDHEGVLALGTPTLASGLDEREIAIIARTLSWLGPLLDVQVEGSEPVVGGEKRQYKASFDGGYLGLEVTVVEGKVEGFAFDEEAWASYSDQALEAEAGVLRVSVFEFVDAEGKPVASPPVPNSISYSLAIEGLEAQLREHHVSIDKSVVDTAGNQVYRQDQPDDIRFPQAEAGSVGGRITGNFGVPGPGSYVLQLTITDRMAGIELEHEIEFTIE